MNDVVWIVERVRHVEHEGSTKHVVSWHTTLAEAEGMAARLQAEFDEACGRVWSRHEVVETIFEMMQEHECGHMDRHHQHHAWRDPEHEAALIEQLNDWWHQESRAWQIFVEDEVMSKMTDPPTYTHELVAHDAEVHYACHKVGRDPAITLAGYAKRAQIDEARNSGDGSYKP